MAAATAVTAAREGTPRARPSAGRSSRRRFLGASGALLAGGATAAALGGCGGPAPAEGQPPAGSPSAPFAGGGALTLLVRAHFVPAFDAWFDAWARAWGETNRVEVSVDHLNFALSPEKVPSEIAAQAGHDVIGFIRGGEVQLYAPHLVDLTDLAVPLGERYGGWIPAARQWGTVQGAWKGIPDYFLDFPANYRTDLFAEQGLKPVDTWDDLLRAGAVLKAKGHPVGIPINQRSNDANNSWSSLLWCHGASTVAPDGKTVAVDSRETREALRYAVELYRTAMTDEVLSWDDTGNNRFLASGRGAWIHNQISALRTIEKDNPELARQVGVSNTPAGPKGRFASVGTSILASMRWSRSQAAARAFLADYFGSYLDGVRASEGYNQPVLQRFRNKPMAVLGEDPRLALLQDFAETARLTGYPGPPTPAAAEVEANWIVPLMVGRAVSDGDVEAAVGWAAQKIRAIYARDR
jgi:multiple sugar transport system substrate-binding protein